MALWERSSRGEQERASERERYGACSSLLVGQGGSRAVCEREMAMMKGAGDGRARVQAGSGVAGWWCAVWRRSRRMTTTRNADAIADAASTALAVRIHARYLSLWASPRQSDRWNASCGALHAEFDADRGVGMQPDASQRERPDRCVCADVVGFIQASMAYLSCEFGPFRLPPGAATAAENRRLKARRFLARPVLGFFLPSVCFSTLGVWPLTFPARARPP